MNLETLLARYEFLKDEGRDVQGRAARGLAFERLLTSLFRSQGIFMTEPFRIVGEQIDGAFEYKGWTYLVEAKWQEAKKSTDALYAFQGKPDRRIEGTRGLFISVSGFYRTSVERFETGRKPNTLLWAGEHLETVLNGLVSVSELLDLSVRFAAERGELLVPLQSLLASRNESLFDAAVEACAAQVDAEIRSAVGKRFIPQLYVERDIQEQLADLIEPERQLERLVDAIGQVGIRLPKLNQKSKQLTKQGRRRETLSAILTALRGQQTRYLPPGNALQSLLAIIPAELNGRMHVLTARAGTGKTNVLCHLAREYARRQPVIFLTGRSGITEITSIRELIDSKLHRFFAGSLPSEHIFDRLMSLLRTRDTSLVVFIDAINEHNDLGLLSLAGAQFLFEIKDKPVTVIASCRDVYWPFFDTSSWPKSQWSKFDARLEGFSPNESHKAINAYFDFYHIEATSPAGRGLNYPIR